MKRTHLTPLVLLAGCLPSLAACGNDAAADAAREAERAVPAAQIDRPYREPAFHLLTIVMSREIA